MANSFDFDVRPLRRVEVHRNPANGRYWQVVLYDAESSVSPERFPDFELRVADALPAAK